MNNDKILELEKKGKVTIITTDNNKYVLKENYNNNFYEYLNARGFNHFPKIYSISDSKLVMEYINDKKIPLEQRLEDIVYLISILHNNTLFDKKIDLDNIKEIYENINNKQDYLMDYYHNLQDEIEEEIYMSPANYLLIRNISLIYSSIKYSKYYLNKFYELVKDKNSFRYSYIHGNLDINHLLEDDNLYLISWDKSRLDLPIYDLIDFYKKNYNNITLNSILSIYEKKMPLQKEEKFLLFSLLILPDEINNNITEYSKTKQISNMIFYIEDLLDYLKDNSKESNNDTGK